MKVCINPLVIAGLIALAEICVFHTQSSFAQDQDGSDPAAYVQAAASYCNEKGKTPAEKDSCINQYSRIAPYCTLEETARGSSRYETCKIGDDSAPAYDPNNGDPGLSDYDTTFTPGEE